MEALAEQRTETRTSISWPVSVWLPEANRFFHGESSNISRTGVFVSMPVTMPISAGNIVEINFPRTDSLAKQKGGYARIKSGKVVRVERTKLLEDAKLGVAVEFELEA